RAGRHQLAAFLIQRGRQADLSGRPIQSLEAAELEFEVIPLRLGQTVELVIGTVERAGCHLVQQRLPDMREMRVHQGDMRLAFPAQGTAEPGSQFQTTRAAAHDDYSM